ncbi:MAG: hypothetical protein U9R07_14085 [Pseudomonadota bacterium]|nr:hypothetical protein [Pseudomonadota bacterium]
MLATMGYTTVMLQTGAAFLQVVTPMTADRGVWNAPGEAAVAHQAWSDRSFRFSIVAPRQAEVAITEAQSISLHNALIASFDEFIAPILIS